MQRLTHKIAQYNPADEELPAPRIGISANRKEGTSCIAETYVNAVLQAGGAPLLLPVTTDLHALTTLVEGLDGLLMSGGGDINPLYLEEEPIKALQDADNLRDEYDILLLQLALNRQIPIFGICRGHQVVNAVLGGTLYQDIYTQAQTTQKHSQQIAREYPSHTVTPQAGSLLQQLFGGKEKIAVNSFHHQAVKEVAPGLRASAVAADGLNEAFEDPEKPLLCVQWHPEAMAANGDKEMGALFRWHVDAARRFAKAKAIHQRILTIDTHTDTPMIFPGSFNIGRKEGGKVNLPFMEEGRIDAVFMVAYIPQGDRDEAGLQAAHAYAIERLTQVQRQEQLNPTRMGIARTPEEIQQLKQAGKKAICLGVENGYALGKELSHLRRFKEMGVSYITLCHNGDNDICDSARGKGEWGGLSPFGKEVVREMNRLGILVDLSHAAERSFYDALAISQVPIVCSHSSARALCDHPRNLTDDQLRALAAQGGVAQVCLYKGFINPEAEKASLTDAIRHINHMVKIMGIANVGIGSDFDGDGELIGCSATNELINITVRLLQEGYTEEEIQKIWGGNWIRVWKQALRYAASQQMSNK